MSIHKNWFLRLTALCAGLGAVPVTIGTIDRDFNLHILLPNWFYQICVVLGAIGVALGLNSAKGKDEHSTIAEVNQSTQVKKMESQ